MIRFFHPRHLPARLTARLGWVLWAILLAVLAASTFHGVATLSRVQ